MAFFHKVGFANPTLWKKTNYYFVKNWSICRIWKMSLILIFTIKLITICKTI